MREVTEFDTEVLEPGSPELPGKMLGRVLENVAVPALSRRAEVIKELLAPDEIDDVS
jgi:hypothetical protein